MSETAGSVANYLSRSARKYPEVPALVSGARSPSFPALSFAELDQSVNWAALELIKSGINRGEKALLCQPRTKPDHLGICTFSGGCDSGGY